MRTLQARTKSPACDFLTIFSFHLFLFCPHPSPSLPCDERGGAPLHHCWALLWKWLFFRIWFLLYMHLHCICCTVQKKKSMYSSIITQFNWGCLCWQMVDYALTRGQSYIFYSEIPIYSSNHFLYPLCPALRVRELTGASLAVIGQKKGYILDKLPVYCRASQGQPCTLTHAPRVHLEFPFPDFCVL